MTLAVKCEKKYKKNRNLFYSNKWCHKVVLSVKIICFMFIPNVHVYEVILCVKIMCFMCVSNVLVLVCLGKCVQNNAASTFYSETNII